MALLRVSVPATFSDRRDALRGIRHRRRVRARLLRAGRSSRGPRADSAGACPARPPSSSSWFRGQERIRFSAVIGGLLALAGIAVMSGATVQDNVPALSLLALVGSALCFAQAAVLVHRFPPVAPGGDERGRHGDGSGAATRRARFWRRKRSSSRRERDTWLALAYLVPVGSVIVFLLYLIVLRHWEASRAAYEFVLIPVVTVVLSAWLDNEPLGLGLLIGGPLVLLGVYVGALRRS